MGLAIIDGVLRFIGKLLGREETPQEPRSQANATAGATTNLERIVWIDDVLYETITSPNGRWTLGWSDASPDGNRIGARGGGKGAWILFESGQERARGRLERPNDGAIANDGRFLLPDWLFTDQLEGEVHAFGPDGRELVSEHVGANIGSTAITADGRLALVETLANPGNREWSNQLLCYDLDAPARRWAAQLPTTIGQIEFGADDTRVQVHLRNDRIVDLSLEKGSFGMAAEEPGTDNIWTAYQELEDEVRVKIVGADGPTLEGWLTRADLLVPRFAAYPGWLAKLHRIRGEVLEAAGKPDDAIAAYSAGLALDPGLGVKRRLKALGVEVPATPKGAPATPPVADNRPYASTVCPSCGAALDPLPKAKSRCRACGASIWVRGGPDGQRHLLREDQLEAHEASWQAAYEAQEREQQLAAERQREADRAAGLIAGLYDVEVVGESHYQDALRRHAGEIGDWGANGSVVVELVREPTNPHDSSAVAVRLDGVTVGYLPRHEAALIAPMLKSLERGSSCRTRATIRGGSSGAPFFGITIDGIPDPYGDT